MVIDNDSISQGLEAALQRTRDRFDVSRGRIDDAGPVLVRVLEAWPAEAHPRFVTLFVELWAIAVIARIANGEPPLTEPQIRDFLGHCSAYFNSFKHK